MIYIVKCEFEIPVEADDKKDLRKKVDRFKGDCLSEYNAEEIIRQVIDVGSIIPSARGWWWKCSPYGSDSDYSIERRLKDALYED